MLNKLKKVKGFTLIELIIVIAIIAILAAIAVPAFGQIRTKANVSADLGNARTIYSVVAAELADEQVILPVFKAETNGTTDIGYTYKLNSIGAGANSTIATNQLPNLSKPKAYQQHEFMVWLDSNGNIEIYVTKGINAGEGKPKSSGNNTAYQVYPTPTTTASPNNLYAK